MPVIDSRKLLGLALSVVIGSLLATQPTLAAGDPAAGLEKSTVCQSCHGKTGNESVDPSYPKLAGQHKDYLIHSLKAYKYGDRENAVMVTFASQLSEQDIEDIAAYYAAQNGLYDLSID